MYKDKPEQAESTLRNVRTFTCSVRNVKLYEVLVYSSKSSDVTEQHERHEVDLKQHTDMKPIKANGERPAKRIKALKDAAVLREEPTLSEPQKARLQKQVDQITVLADGALGT